MARRDQYLEHLRTVPLFSQCSKKELTEVARLVTPVVVQPGSTFIREGDVARELMIIESGEATVRRKGRKLTTLGPGAVVGETAVVLERPRNASVTADTEVAMLVIDSRAFSTLLDDIPGFARKILHTVAQRLADQV